MAIVAPAAAQDTPVVQERSDSVTLRFVDADLRAVVQALGRYLPKPVLVSGIPANRVSLETQVPVPRAQVTVLLRGLIESQNLLFDEDSSYVRIGPKPADGPPATQSVGPSDTSRVQLFVYRLKHARAGDVAATVNLLFGGSGEFSGRSGLSSGTLSEELRRDRIKPSEGSRGGAAERPNSGATDRPSASLTGATTIVPDELTNSLLIRAGESDYAVLKQAIDQLDIRPLQVLIEVLIVEARRDRSFTLNADLFLPTQSLGGNATASGSVAGGGVGDMVIRLMNLGKPDIDAVLGVSERKGDVQIISRPVLVASNNTEARFLVGSQRPFVQVSRSLPTDNASRDQVIQYRDVGTKLTVRPTINQDGYVSLIIQQEINAATSEVAFDAPVISTREASTQVLVRDGQTIVLGGLQDRQRDVSSRGVPILSGIPIIGGLFGSTERRGSTTELFLFLTPRILRTDDDVDQVTMPRLPRESPP